MASLVELRIIGNFVTVIVRIANENTARGTKGFDVTLTVSDLKNDGTAVGFYRPFEHTEFVLTIEYLYDLGDQIIFVEAFFERLAGIIIDFGQITNEPDFLFFFAQQSDV